jgi:hypothetical protein
MAFESNVDVARIVDDNDYSKVVEFKVEMRIRCKECKTRFQWVGIDPGMSPAKPMMSFDGFELRAPIRPVQEAEYVI